MTQPFPAEGAPDAELARAVDNHEHAASGSATLPHRGAEPGTGSPQAAPATKGEAGKDPARATPAGTGPAALPERSGPDGGRLRDVLETATLVIAPTTVITALLFYFGWAQPNALFGRLGIDQSALGFTVQDYLLRSVNSTFRPMSVVLLAAVAGLSAHIAVTRAVATPGRAGLAERLWPVAMVVGGLLLLAGLSGCGGWCATGSTSRWCR